MIKTIINFVKIEHTAFSLPLLFAGAWIGAGQRWPGTRLLLLIVLAAVGARIVGMACNRILDRRLDALNPRTAGRELPSGAMTLAQALAVTLCGVLIYFAACAILGPICLLWSPMPLIPLIGYSLLKRYTALCHFGIGLCLALAPLGAFVAVSGSLRFSSAVLLFSLFVFLWLSGADIIYALLDLESDRRNGVHSLPAMLGSTGAQIVSATVHASALLCLVRLLRVANAGGLSWACFGVTALLFMTMYLPFIPIPRRFFPLASLSGVFGAITLILM